MVKLFASYLVEVVMDVIGDNVGKAIVIRTKSSYTCIDASRGVRYAVGKGKEGKYINIKDLRKFLKSKNIISYAVVEDDSIDLLSDDVKTLSYVKMPTEAEFKALKKEEEEKRQKYFIDEDVKTWRERLTRSINEGKIRIFGYNIEEGTCRYKDVVLDLGETIMYIGCENEYNLNLIEELISELQHLQKQLDSVVDDGINDGETFYIKTMKDGKVAIEEVQGVKFENKYGFELFYHKVALGNYKLTHMPTGIALGDTITYDVDNLSNKLDEFVKKHGKDKVVELFNSAIDMHGTVPNYSTAVEEVAVDDVQSEVVVNDGVNEGNNVVNDGVKSKLKKVSDMLCHNGTIVPISNEYDLDAGKVYLRYEDFVIEVCHFDIGKEKICIKVYDSDDRPVSGNSHMFKSIKRILKMNKLDWGRSSVTKSIDIDIDDIKV